MQNNLQIRPAQIADAAACVPIMIDVLGNIADMLAGSTLPKETWTTITYFFGQTHNRLSYLNCTVATIEGQVVGVLVAYHGSQITTLDQPYIDRIWREKGQKVTIVKEAQDDEYYLDTLGVLAQYRGLGIGTALIYQFEQQAAQQGYKKVALLVDKTNVRAYQLYQSLGYEADSELIVCEHDFWHLSKELN